MFNEHIIDISSHQKTFDSFKAKRNGITHVIIREGYGSKKDSKFDIFVDAAKKASLRIGAYHFSTWHYSEKNNKNFTEARYWMHRQVSEFISNLKNKPIDFYVAIDQEMEHGFSMGLSIEENTQLINEEIEVIKNAGYNPCVYCSPSWAIKNIDIDKITAPFWFAYYYASPNDPDFDSVKPIENIDSSWANWIKKSINRVCMWQFGRINNGYKYGVGSVNVDRSVMFKSMEEIKMIKVPNLNLVVTNDVKPACQAFSTRNVNDPNFINLKCGRYVIDEIDEGWDHISPVFWCTISQVAPFENKKWYVMVLNDRCHVEKEVPKVPETNDKVELNINQPVAKLLRDIADIIDSLEKM